MPAEKGIQLFFLGGLGEIGMNCAVLEGPSGSVMIDCGVTFPKEDLGVDVYHPDFETLDVAPSAVVITHGHEDHIGAIPYLLKQFPKVPIWGPRHALELVKQRLSEHEIPIKQAVLMPFEHGRSFEVAGMKVSPLRVTHSVSEAAALAFDTPAGVVIHTGDFKFDPTPSDGKLTDEAALKALGDRGVALMLSDSTGADTHGHSGTEKTVAEALRREVLAAPARVVVALFSSNVARMQVLADVAHETGRRLLLLGRSVKQHVEAAEAVGELTLPQPPLTSVEEAAKLAPNELLIVAAGTQAEPMSSLVRLARGALAPLELKAPDVVLMSSRIIPGLEPRVYGMLGDFYRSGVTLRTPQHDPRLHVSGHAYRDELAQMLALTRPASLLPVHGTLHHMMRHAELARELGIADVLVAENGDVVELEKGKRLRKVDFRSAEKVATTHGVTIPDEVLAERARIGRTGLVFVTVAIAQNGDLRGSPQVWQRGVLSSRELDIQNDIQRDVLAALGRATAKELRTDARTEEIIRVAARRCLEKRIGLRPPIVTSILRG